MLHRGVAVSCWVSLLAVLCFSCDLSGVVCGTVVSSEKPKKDSNLITAALLSSSAHLLHHFEGTQYDLYGVVDTGSLLRVGECTVPTRSIIFSASRRQKDLLVFARVARLQSFVTSPGSKSVNFPFVVVRLAFGRSFFFFRESCDFPSNAPVYHGAPSS